MAGTILESRAKLMFESGKMRNKSFGIITSLAISTALALPVSITPGAVNTASADVKNYLKVSKNAIGKSQRVQVGLNKSLVIDLPDHAHDILVANPIVADAVTRTSKRIYIFAKQVGETNIFIFDKNGKQLLSLDLSVERDVAGLKQYIEKYVRGSEVEIEIVNDNIVLTGRVPTPQASAKAVQLAQIFVKGGEATTGTSSSSSSGTGTVINFGDEDDRTSAIVNLLSIDGEDQVNLKVTVAEIQRNVIKQLGIDITSAISSGGLTASLFGDNPLGLGKIKSASSANFSTSWGGNTLSGAIQALNQSGVMRTLAEPSLTAISGEQASFSVGGEYSIPTGKSEDAGTVTYTFREIEYGISLTFTPIVLGPGRISLRLTTAVAEPTNEGTAVTPRGSVGSVSQPGVRRREASTTVELPSGGSMVIAGLLKDDVRQVVSGFPGLSKIPVLGTLFRSRDYQRYESELVIIVTPYLVKPVSRHALARPDDNFQAAADSSAMFLGRVNRIYGTVDGKLPNGRYRGNPGFIFK